MIPPPELSRLHDIHEEALLLWAEGRPLAGYRKLDFALTCVDSPAVDPLTGEEDPPEPWERALADTCRRLMVEYVALIGPAGEFLCRSEAPATDVQRQKVLAAYLRAEAAELRNAAWAARARSRELCDQRRSLAAAAPCSLPSPPAQP